VRAFLLALTALLTLASAALAGAPPRREITARSGEEAAAYACAEPTGSPVVCGRTEVRARLSSPTPSAGVPADLEPPQQVPVALWLEPEFFAGPLAGGVEARPPVQPSTRRVVVVRGCGRPC